MPYGTPVEPLQLPQSLDSEHGTTGPGHTSPGPDGAGHTFSPFSPGPGFANYSPGPFSPGPGYAGYSPGPFSPGPDFTSYTPSPFSPGPGFGSCGTPGPHHLLRGPPPWAAGTAAGHNGRSAVGTYAAFDPHMRQIQPPHFVPDTGADEYTGYRLVYQLDRFTASYRTLVVFYLAM